MTIYSLDIFLFLFGTICCSMSSSNCCFLTCIQISQEAGQVGWYSHLFKNFPHRSTQSKFFKPGFSNTWTMNFQMFRLVLEKAEEPEIKLPTSTGSCKKQESSRKASISALLTMPKPLTVWITTNCGKFWKRWEYQTTSPASWETYMQVRKQELELDMEQQTGSI